MPPCVKGREANDIVGQAQTPWSGKLCKSHEALKYRSSVSSKLRQICPRISVVEAKVRDNGDSQMRWQRSMWCCQSQEGVLLIGWTTDGRAHMKHMTWVLYASTARPAWRF